MVDGQCAVLEVRVKGYAVHGLGTVTTEVDRPIWKLGAIPGCNIGASS